MEKPQEVHCKRLSKLLHRTFAPTHLTVSCPWKPLDFAPFQSLFSFPSLSLFFPFFLFAFLSLFNLSLYSYFSSPCLWDIYFCLFIFVPTLFLYFPALDFTSSSFFLLFLCPLSPSVLSHLMLTYICID